MTSFTQDVSGHTEMHSLHFSIVEGSRDASCIFFTVYEKHTASPWHGCFNTTAVTETTPSFFVWTFWRHYANISSWWCRHVVILGGCGRVLTLIDNISIETLVFATSGIFSMHKQSKRKDNLKSHHMAPLKACLPVYLQVPSMFREQREAVSPLWQLQFPLQH